MAFVTTTVNVIPISINDFVPDFVASINANNDEFKRLIEYLYNNLEISTDDKSIGSVSGINYIWSNTVEASADTLSSGFYLKKTNGVNRNTVASINYGDMGSGVMGSIAMADKVVVNKILDASNADVQVKSLSATEGITFGSTSIVEIAGLLNASGAMAESYDNTTKIIDVGVDGAEVNGTLTLNKYDKANLFLTLRLSADLYTVGGSYAPGYIANDYYIYLDITSDPDVQLVPGQKFNITIASITDSNGTVIDEGFKPNAVKYVLVCGTNQSNAHPLTFTDPDLTNKLTLVPTGDTVNPYKTNVELMYMPIQPTDEKFHVKNVFNYNA